MPRTVGVRVRVRSSEKSDSFAEVRFNLESSLKPETKFLLESASLSSSPRSVSPPNYCTDSNSGVASLFCWLEHGAWSLEPLLRGRLRARERGEIRGAGLVS